MTFIIMLTAAGTRGQTLSPGRAKAAPDYSKESFIIEKLLTVATFENDGTSTRSTTSVVRIQKVAAATPGFPVTSRFVQAGTST